MTLLRPLQLILLVKLLYLALYLAPQTVTADETIDIGSRRELLLDEHLIEQLTGQARLRLHHPVPTDDVFVHDTPWEGNRTLYYTIFRDGDRYRMYYRGSQIETTAAGYSIPYNVTCYAESQDGIHWTRPDLGLVEFRGSRKNNILLSGEICHAFVPFKDSNPACPAEHRYKAIVAIYKPQRGLHVYSSPDGIRWAPMHDAPVITTGYFDSQNLAFWDTVRQRYVGFHRALRGGPGQLTPASKETSTKDVMTATSTDFLNWSQPHWLEYSDERWIPFTSRPSPTSPYVQLYTNQIQPYHRAPHIYLGFPTRYVDSRATLTDLNRKLAASVKYFGAAYSDGGLMSSRDGQRFKFWDDAFIRPGNPARKRWVYGDNFQSWGLIETQSNIPAAPNELSLYVNEGFWRQCKLRRYRLRLDGFVSAFAPLRGGELLTRPFTMSGTRLKLNLETSAAGSIRVEIQTPAGEPLDGYQATDCHLLFGDSLERVVEWQRGSDLSALSGVPLRLRILIKGADLYALQFTP